MDDKPKQIEELKTAIVQCLEYDVDAVVVNPDWGKVDFKAAEPDLHRLRFLLEPLRDNDLMDIPAENLDHIKGAVAPVTTYVEAIKSFDLKGEGDPYARRDNIVAELRVASDALYNNASHVVSYLFSTRSAAGDANRGVAEARRQFERDSQAALKYMADRRLEIDSVARAAKEITGTAGVAEFTYDFETQANNHGTASDLWLWCTAALAFASLGLALWFLYFPTSLPAFDVLTNSPTTEKALGTIHFITSKLLVFGIVLSATVWCGWMYRTNKHQETINRHRANSLRTFQAFVQAAEADTDVRNAILLETTRSIFASLATGYIKGEPSGGGLNVIELSKTVRDKTGATSD